MSTAANRPNFFLLLELDPDVPWSQTDFEIRLRQKQIQWARETNSPIKEVKNATSSNLRLVGKIKEVMEDDTMRHEEAKYARSQYKALKAARLARLDSAIEFYRNDGYITRKEFDALLRDYADVISASDLRVRVGVVIRDDSEQTPQTPQSLGLEPAVAKSIRANLDFLGEYSLYTLLNIESLKAGGQPLGPGSSSSDLVAAAYKLYQRMINHMDKGPENTARSSLGGTATSLFRTEEMRRKYNTTLRLEPLDALIEEIARLCQPVGMVSQ